MGFVLRGGRVVDGTGAPACFADVEVDGGRIVAVGEIAARAGLDEIDVSGLTVAPGFIARPGSVFNSMIQQRPSKNTV